MADDRKPVPLPNTGAVSQPILAQLLGIESTIPNYNVDSATLVGLPAADAAINVVAQAVGLMLKSSNVYALDGTEVPKPTIIRKPNVLLGATEFYQQVVRTLLMHGNYVALIKNEQLIPVNPLGVSLDVTSGLPTYTIENNNYGWNDVLHIRKDAPVGTLWGQGIITKYRLQVEGMLAQQEYGKSSFTNGGVPTGIITLDTEQVTQDQLDNVHDQWLEKTTGGRDVVVLPKSIGFTHLTWSPEDAQFVNAVGLTIAQAAYMAGLKPSDLEASVGGSSLTYANLTDRQNARIVDSYAPVMALIEEAFSELVSPNEVKGNPESLLRTSTRERYELHLLAQQAGIETVDETRFIENKLPLPESEKVDTDANK